MSYRDGASKDRGQAKAIRPVCSRDDAFMRTSSQSKAAVQWRSADRVDCVSHVPNFPNICTRVVDSCPA